MLFVKFNQQFDLLPLAISKLFLLKFEMHSERYEISGNWIRSAYRVNSFVVIKHLNLNLGLR